MTVAAPDGRRPTVVAAPVMRRVVARCRVVVDNDFAGDPDGLVGLAHHLLSPTNRVTAITSSFLNPRFAESATTAEEGVRLAAELVDVVGTAGRPLVVAGTEEAWKPGPAPRRRTRSWPRR